MSTDGVTVRPVRRGDLQDTAGVAGVLNEIIAAGRETVLTGHWTAEAERDFLQSLGPRSEVFVAEVAGRIAAFQVIEPFVTYTSAMAHVCHVGTYVRAPYRGQGIGRQLAARTLAFAREQGYEKSVVYVLAHNQAGQAYYRSLGFETRGVLARQAKIDGVYYDELFMECLFDAP